MKNRPRGGLGRGLGALIPTAPVPVAAEAGGGVATAEPPTGGPAAAPASASVPVAAPASPAPAAPPAVETFSPAEPAGAQLAPVPGARFAEIPVSSIIPNPKQPRQVFDEEALEELKVSIQEVGFLQPIVVRAPRRREVRTRHGRATLARRPGGRPGDDSGDRAGHPRRRHAAGRSAGEHPPRQPQSAGRGRRLPAAAGGVRCHARGAGPANRPQPPADLQHHPTAEPAAAGAAPGGGRCALGRACACAAGAGRRRGPGGAGAPDRGGRTLGACDRGDRPAGARRRPREDRRPSGGPSRTLRR